MSLHARCKMLALPSLFVKTWQTKQVSFAYPFSQPCTTVRAPTANAAGLTYVVIRFLKCPPGYCAATCHGFLESVPLQGLFQTLEIKALAGQPCQ